MAYADYDFYKNEYYGELLDEPSFSILSERGSEYISYITDGKSDSADLSDSELKSVKKCNCAIADLLSEYGTMENGSVLKSSESVGSWSVSYKQTDRKGGGNNSTLMSAIIQKMRVYLSNTDLMYMGVE